MLIATTFDLAESYNQVLVREKDRPKTAFATDWVLYECNVMSFGLTNAPDTFQRMMTMILGSEIGKTCLVYLDDILIYSSSREQHYKDVYVICFRLAASGLKLKWKKCKIEQKEVEYLGHIISSQFIKPSPMKVQTIVDFPTPVTIKQMRGFLGLTSYFRKFIQNFSSLAAPLNDATTVKDENGKTVMIGKKQSEKYPVKLSKEGLEAFEKLKQYLTTTSNESSENGILLMPDLTQQFIVYTDACDEGLCAVLCQNDQSKKCRPVAFYSKKLRKAERKYATGEKELMAIVFAMGHFKVYLYSREFIVRTDHRPLQWLNNLPSPSTRLERWLLMVRQFEFKIEFVSDISNAAADALSRFFVYGDEEEDESEPGIVLKNVGLIQDQQVEVTQDEDLMTLKKWIMSRTKPEKLKVGNSAELHCYHRHFDKFKVMSGNVYRETSTVKPFFNMSFREKSDQRSSNHSTTKFGPAI